VRGAVLVLVLALVPPAAAAGQASPERGPSRALAPHERLAVFEGTWTLAEAGEGPSFQETCAWLPEGRRHLVCRSRFWSEQRAVEHMMVYSYTRADSTYVVTAFLAPGQVWRYVGGPDADRWVFDLETDRADGPRIRTVVTVRPDTLHFVEEVSEDGGAWRTTEDYRHVRVQGPAGARHDAGW
jgi:hypothetical protein